MIREELDSKVSALLNEKADYQTKIEKINSEVSALQTKYVAEYPHLIKKGSKVRIKSLLGGFNGGTHEKEVIVFVGDTHFYQKYDYRESQIYPDKDIMTMLHQVKKDGTQSSRTIRVYGKIVEIEILEQ